VSDVFESGVEMMDVTSMNRPDTAWHVVDAQGHEHQWYVRRPACRHCGHLAADHVKNERIGGGDVWLICPEQRLVDTIQQMTRYEPLESVPAGFYNPSARHELPTLAWVVDGVEYDSDGEPFAVGHYECAQCGEPVQPKSTADTVKQLIPGLRWYRINGRSVSPEEYKAALAEWRRYGKEGP